MAMSLLTILPVTALLPSQWSLRQQGLSVLCYPLVGLLLAVCLCSLVYVLPPTLPALLSATLLVLLWVILTGALHLDGLADAVDVAFAAHRLQGDDKAVHRLLHIFKEPTVGTMAVVALLFVLLLKILLLSFIVQQSIGLILLALVLAQVLPRVLLVASILLTPYVRKQGMGSGLFAAIPRVSAVSLLIAVSLVVLLLLPAALSLSLLLCLSALFFLWRALWMRLIGGFVGDCLGALIEMAELVVLFVFYWVMILP